MKGLCRYWDAQVVIEKLWSMSELKKARPKGVNLNLTQISRMWLKEKWWPLAFMSDAKFSTYEMQRLYIEQGLLMYNIKKKKGFFCNRRYYEAPH